MMISILAGFLGDLFFLPALLKMVPRLVKTVAKVPSMAPSLGITDASEEESEASIQKVAAAVALAVICLHSFPAQAQTAAQILKKSQTQLDSKDDQAKVEMKIIEKSGEVKTRVIEMKTLRSNGFSVLAKIQSPADIKGMGFLGQVKNGEEAQWIYLPSSGQVRRVVTGQTKGGLLGSELSPEDLNSNAVKTAKAQVVKTDNSGWWIEVVPAKGTSTYTKAVTQISRKDFLPQKTEYFVGSRLKKTVEFRNYTKIGPAWRAQLIDVRNHLNGRGTQIKLSQMRLNAGLKSQDFSQAALKED